MRSLLIALAFLCIILLVRAAEPATDKAAAEKPAVETAPLDDFQYDIKKFTEWLDAKSSFKRNFDVVEVNEHDQGFVGNVKIVANKEIEVGEEVYRFPTDLRMAGYKDADGDNKQNSEDEENTKAAKSADFQGLNRTEYYRRSTMQMLNLIWEKVGGIQSDWFPYLNIIPNELSYPLFWNIRMLEEINGTTVFGTTVRMNQTLSMGFSDLITSGMLQSRFNFLTPKTVSEVFSFGHWKWSYVIFRSRSWKLNEGARMQPVTEFFSYAEPSMVSIKVEGDEIVLTATARIPEGSNIVINEEMLPNRELLDRFGFVLPSNPEESVPIGMAIKSSDELYAFKRDLLAQKGISEKKTYLLKVDFIPPELVFHLRVHHLTQEDLPKAENALHDRTVTLVNEDKVTQSLAQFCEASMSLLKFSLQDDYELLKDPELPLTRYNAVVLRSHEKRILLSVQKMAQMRMEEVQRGIQEMQEGRTTLVDMEGNPIVIEDEKEQTEPPKSEGGMKKDEKKGDLSRRGEKSKKGKKSKKAKEAKETPAK